MNGLTAVVTDGTTGVGASVARRFADEGARVVVGGRDAADVEEVVAAIEDDGGTATGVRTDVRDEFDLERLMETAARFGDGLDVVVPSARVAHGSPGETPLPGESYAAFDDTLRTNVRGVFAAVREAVPHLADDARVLVPTDGVASAGERGYGAYAVSTAAVEALARGFAADLDLAVGCLDAGTVAGHSNGAGSDPDEVAGSFVRAATDLPADELDGTVLEVDERGVE